MDAPVDVIELIRTGQIDEGQSAEFKARVDLAKEASKTLLIRAAVAFLNANAGHIYVGVRESNKDRKFEAFEPYDGVPDEVARRLQSILLDGIDPKPIGLVVEPIEIDGGFLLDVHIPDLRMRPYQARGTGAFHIRTGRQNTPISRDQVRALFTTEEEFKAAAFMLMEREDRALEKLNPKLFSEAVTLHVAIVPFEYFEGRLPPYTGWHGNVDETFHHWHGHEPIRFSGCESGVQSVWDNVGAEATFVTNPALHVALSG